MLVVGNSNETPKNLERGKKKAKRKGKNNKA